MAIKGILFDLDGVLIDSEGTYTRFWQQIDNLYPTGIPNFAIAIKGTTLPAIMEHFPDPQVKERIIEALGAFQNSMTFNLYPDTIAFLNQIRDAGLRCAIVTSSDPAKMERLYSQHPTFRGYFDAVIDASMVAHSKPHPDPYLRGAAALGLDPGECCVFEDSIQGLKAGRASGAKVVALATTYPADRLAPLADIVISRLTELPLSSLIR